MFTNDINLNTKPLNTIFSTVEKGYLFKVWPYIEKVTFLK